MLLAALFWQQAVLPPVRRAGCFRQELHDGNVAVLPGKDRTCVPLGPPAVIEGIWLRAFEGSELHEGAKVRSELLPSAKAPWLNADEPLKPFTIPAQGVDVLPGRLYRVRFVGRRSLAKNGPPLDGFGHMGGSPSLVLVDEMLSIEDLGPLAPLK